MNTQIFNQDGIANVRDLNLNIQEQYKGCGRGSIVMSQDGEAIALIYNGHIPKDKVAEVKAQLDAYNEAGHVFAPCSYSSGQILLD